MLLLSVCFRVIQFSTHFPSFIPRLRKLWSLPWTGSGPSTTPAFLLLLRIPSLPHLKFRDCHPASPEQPVCAGLHAVLWTILQNYSCWTQQLFLCQSNKGGTALRLSADSLHWGIGYFNDVLCKREQGPLGILFLLILLILSLRAPSGSYSCFNPLPLIILSSPPFLCYWTPNLHTNLDRKNSFRWALHLSSGKIRTLRVQLKPSVIHRDGATLSLHYRPTVPHSLQMQNNDILSYGGNQLRLSP